MSANSAYLICYSSLHKGLSLIVYTMQWNSIISCVILQCKMSSQQHILPLFLVCNAVKQHICSLISVQCTHEMSQFNSSYVMFYLINTQRITLDFAMKWNNTNIMLLLSKAQPNKMFLCLIAMQQFSLQCTTKWVTSCIQCMYVI